MATEKFMPKVNEIYRYSYDFGGRIFTVEARVDAIETGGSEAIIMVRLSHGASIYYDKSGCWYGDSCKLLSLEKIG